MLLYVMDKNFHTLTNISEYSYAAYTEEYNGLGNFVIHTIANADSMIIRAQGYYVMLEKDVCGIIQSIQPAVDVTTREKTLVIQGYLVTELLTRRCIPKSTSFNGTTVAFVNKLVNENCVNPADTSRRLPIILDSVVPSDSHSEQRQVTGGSVEEAIVELLDAREMGHRVAPIISSKALTGFKFTQLKGVDRTIGNSSGNAPVVFSTSLKNVLAGVYSYNSQDYKNTAYVAGEGEDVNRVIRVVNPNNTGVDRYELYVDARDLQSTDEEGNTLTAAEYNKVLENRGLEQLKEYIISETYEATLNQEDQKYHYREDYFLGDKVSIKDDELGVYLNTAISAVQISDTVQEIKIDVTFGNSKIKVADKLKRKGVI